MYDTLGQHARSGDNVSDNSREGVKNENVDKIRWLLEKQKQKHLLNFQRTNNMWLSEIQCMFHVVGF